MITVVLLKTIDKNVIKKGTTENKKNLKLTNIHPKNDVLKTSKSQRYSNYYGLRKNRTASRTLTVIRGCRFLEPFQQKMENPVSILAPLEIRKGTLNLTFSVRWSFKVVKFWYKSLSHLHKVDFIVDFLDFGVYRKIDVFSIAFRAVKKSQKSSRGAPKGRQGDFGYAAKRSFWARGVPIQ